MKLADDVFSYIFRCFRDRSKLFGSDFAPRDFGFYKKNNSQTPKQRLPAAEVKYVYRLEVFM